MFVESRALGVHESLAGPHRRHLGNAPDHATLGVVVRGFQRARRVGPLAGHAPASSRSRRDGHGWIWLCPDSDGGLLRPMPGGFAWWASGIHIRKECIVLLVQLSRAMTDEGRVE